MSRSIGELRERLFLLREIEKKRASRYVLEFVLRWTCIDEAIGEDGPPRGSVEGAGLQFQTKVC